MESIYWLVIFIAFLVIEIITLGLTTIWFAVGALASFILALLGVNLTIQIVIFLVVSILMIILLRPFAMKFLNNKVTKTNVDELIGRTAKVISTIDNVDAKGKAMIDGEEWTARSVDNALTIPAGTLVIINRVEGVKLIVDINKEETK